MKTDPSLARWQDLNDDVSELYADIQYALRSNPTIDQEAFEEAQELLQTVMYNLSVVRDAAALR